jgi:hypothetical protein
MRVPANPGSSSESVELLPGFAGAGKSREQFHALSFGRAERCDLFVRKISAVIECSRVAVIPRLVEFGRKKQALPIEEAGHQHLGLVLAFEFLRVEVDSDSTARIVDSIRSAYLFGLKIDRFPHFAADYSRSSFVDDMSSDCKIPPIFEAKQIWCSGIGRSAQLNCQDSA